jgi:hypothetical protein
LKLPASPPAGRPAAGGAVAGWATAGLPPVETAKPWQPARRLVISHADRQPPGDRVMPAELAATLFV